MAALSSCGVVDSDSGSSEYRIDRSQFTQVSVPVEQGSGAQSKSIRVLPPMQAVSLPEDASWLLDSIHITLHDLDAKEAVTLIVREHAVRFDLHRSELPVVTYASRSRAHRERRA